MTKPKKPTKHAAQQRYDADKTKAGEHVQANVKFKTEADVAMVARLRARFGKPLPTIIRMALRELDVKKN